MSSLNRYILEPNESSSRRTYTLRTMTPTPTILAATLDEADIVFSTGGFRYRTKTLEDEDEDTTMDIGVNDMSDLRRVGKWWYTAEPTTAS